MNHAVRHLTGAKVLYASALVLGGGVLAICIIWPTAALVARCVTDGWSRHGMEAIGARQFGLLWRSIELSAAATVVAHALAIVAVFGLVRTHDVRGQPIVFWLLAVGLACPPMACVFGWAALAPSAMIGKVGCVATWALWAWPVPAMLLASAWSRLARGPFDAAILETRRWPALWWVALPALRRHVTSSLLIVFVFLLNEYTVPHACGLSVYATELLGVAASSARMVDSLRLALLPAAVTLLALAAMMMSWRRLDGGDGFDTWTARTNASPVRSAWPVAMLFVLSWGFPLLGLAMRLGAPSAIATAVRTYGTDLATTALVALTGGALAVVMGVAVACSGRTARLWLVWTLTLGTLPGALIGLCVIAAFNGPVFAVLFDHWPVIAVGHVARFGWIGVAAGLLLRRLSPPALADQARVDGASASAIFAYVKLPIGTPVLTGAAVLIAVLSMGDIATTSLLRVPDFSPIALVIVEKFHRFEDGMLAALSLILISAAMTAVAWVGWVARIAGRRWR